MKRHLAYLRYLLAHKKWVYVAGRQLGLSRWRLLIHDWHKFLPGEWFPYAEAFYNPDGTKSKYAEREPFKHAWNRHQKRGRHHWQAWVLVWDRGDVEPLEMPLVFAAEMVADWHGAGRAITGKWDTASWYARNKDKIRLHPKTRELVEKLLTLEIE